MSGDKKATKAAAVAVGAEGEGRPGYRSTASGLAIRTGQAAPPPVTGTVITKALTEYSPAGRAELLALFSRTRLRVVPLYWPSRAMHLGVPRGEALDVLRRIQRVPVRLHGAR